MSKTIGLAMYDEYLSIYRDSYGRMFCSPDIKKVIYSGPCTIVLWGDGTKTMVRCTANDIKDEKTGLALCVAKRFLPRKLYREVMVPILCRPITSSISGSISRELQAL
jgi:hypothetical protein